MSAKTFTATDAASANIVLADKGKGSQAVHDLVTAYRANRRTGSANTKTRGEVRGNNKKIYRQKGTGGARHGDKRAPIFVGGGVVFGPRPRDYSKHVTKTVRRLALRARVAREEAYSLNEGRGTADRRELAGIFFFPPLQGIVTSKFDRRQDHFGIDVVSQADAAVKACLNGTVTLASWTTDAGHVLHVQHANDLVSIYKHNSVLLKKVGDKVKAGEAVAIVGDSGELTTGPHLHFELWLNGEAVDPEAYMVFQ